MDEPPWVLFSSSSLHVWCSCFILKLSMGIGTTLTYGRYRTGCRMDKVSCQIGCSGSLCLVLMLRRLRGCFTTLEMLLLRQPPSPMCSAHPSGLCLCGEDLVCSMHGSFSQCWHQLACTALQMCPAIIITTTTTQRGYPQYRKLVLSREGGDNYRGCFFVVVLFFGQYFIF